MNLQILASQIVARVRLSPDSVTNLEQVVAQLIRQEIDRDWLDAIENTDRLISKDCPRHRTED